MMYFAVFANDAPILADNRYQYRVTILCLGSKEILCTIAELNFCIMKPHPSNSSELVIMG